eukprot:6760805-Pyramimonas_sp.AAC.1
MPFTVRTSERAPGTTWASQCGTTSGTSRRTSRRHRWTRELRGRGPSRSRNPRKRRSLCHWPRTSEPNALARGGPRGPLNTECALHRDQLPRCQSCREFL